MVSRGEVAGEVCLAEVLAQVDAAIFAEAGDGFAGRGSSA